MVFPNSLQVPKQNIFEPVMKVYNELSTHWQAFGRKFLDWTENTFSPEHAQKVTKVFNGLPYTALTLFVPWSLVIPALAAYYIVDIVFGPFQAVTYETIYSGVGVGAGLVAVSHVFGFLSTLNPLHLLATAIYGYVSYQLMTKGKLIA